MSSTNPARLPLNIPTKLNNMKLNTSTFQSLDSTASLFRSEEFMNSLNAYRESMAKAGGGGGGGVDGMNVCS